MFTYLLLVCPLLLSAQSCGVNVTNSQPTKCLNDIISEYNAEHTTQLPPLSMETVLAVTLNNFERIVKQFQEHGPSAFLDEYYDKWLHRYTVWGIHVYRAFAELSVCSAGQH